VISLRFTGGPLDGRIHPTQTPAYEYRIIGGVYRRGRTHRRAAPDSDAIIVYSWRPDSGRSHTSRPEPVYMW
jgi:hypothetical protein